MLCTSKDTITLVTDKEMKSRDEVLLKILDIHGRYKLVDNRLLPSGKVVKILTS